MSNTENRSSNNNFPTIKIGGSVGGSIVGGNANGKVDSFVGGDVSNHQIDSQKSSDPQSQDPGIHVGGSVGGSVVGGDARGDVNSTVVGSVVNGKASGPSNSNGPKGSFWSNVGSVLAVAQGTEYIVKIIAAGLVVASLTLGADYLRKSSAPVVLPPAIQETK